MRSLIVTSCAVAIASVSACATMRNAAGTVDLPMADAITLRQDMRKLWSDHVVWTRQYIVAAVANDPSAPVALNRLMKNQEHIGTAIVPYYGAGAGAKLTELLKGHIAVAGDLVAAAKAGDAAKKTDADRRWHENAAEIATFLANANPNWHRDHLLMMLNEHLALTTQEAVARLQKNWTEDQVTFDRIYDQAMGMADMLSSGILKQFPPKA
jgi:hypothetical protein